MHAGMLADRVAAGMLVQPLDRGADSRKPAFCCWSRSELRQPSADRVEVVTCPRRIDQPAWHVAAGLATAGRWRRQFVIDADGVNPCADFIRIDVETGIEFRIGFSDHLGLPGDSTLAVGIDLGMGRCR